MSAVPAVSVCLPTWNGAADLARLLPRLAEQRLVGGFELVAVDSSSSDGSADLLARAGARVETIPKEAFHHARTRQRLAELARGEFLVFLSQDALPADAGFLAAITAPFADERIAGVAARILPHEDDDPLTARTALALPEAGAVAREFGIGDGTPPLNDVASAIRAADLARVPFPDVAFGEDRAWAEAAIAAGRRIAFAPAALVRHAHRYTPRGAFARNAIDARFHLQHYGRRLRPGMGAVLKGFVHECVADLRYLAGKRPRGAVGALFRSPFLRGAQVLGQYCGGRARR